MLKLPSNEPEAEEADGDVNETYDKIDDYWGAWGGGGKRRRRRIIKGRVTLTINIVKMLHAFFEERKRLHTPITMMMMMMVITRMAKRQ